MNNEQPTAQAPSEKGTVDDHKVAMQKTRYEATMSLWIHLDQARHTLLYNYLMASTILLLAWATVFSSGSAGRKRVLICLAASGALLSLVWIFYGCRGNEYVEKYANLAKDFEKDFEKLTWKNNWPFHKRDNFINELQEDVKMVSSKRVIPGVPVLFLVLYIILFYTSSQSA